MASQHVKKWLDEQCTLKPKGSATEIRSRHARLLQTIDDWLTTLETVHIEPADSSATEGSLDLPVVDHDALNESKSELDLLKRQLCQLIAV